MTPGYIYIIVQLPLYPLVPISYHIKPAQIYYQNYETVSTSMFASQFDQINHHWNECLIKTRTPQYIYAKIQLPSYILLPITYRIKHARIYFKNSETNSTSMSTSKFNRIATKKYPYSKVILFIFLSQVFSIRCTFKILFLDPLDSNSGGYKVLFSIVTVGKD